MLRYSIEIPCALESLRIAAPFTDAVLHDLPDVPERDRLIHDLALVAKCPPHKESHGEVVQPLGSGAAMVLFCFRHTVNQLYTNCQ